jgi:small conductance mechanosensitive channel
MRLAFILILLLLGAAPAAQAQIQAPLQALVQHQPPTKTGVPSGPAIIPGSALAALTSAAQPAPAPEDTTPAPFGTNRLAFVITGTMGRDAARSLAEFMGAIDASTRITPITDWLSSFTTDQQRRAAAAAILRALLLALLPGALVDAIARFVLRRPAAVCARWALPRQEEFLPSTEIPDDDDATSAATPAAPLATAAGQDIADEAAVSQKHARRVSLVAWGRRLFFALLRFLLLLLPLAGFAITVQVLLVSGLIPPRAAQLAVVGIANAYLVCRAVQELVRMFFAPYAPSVRVVAMPTARAQAIEQWLRVFLATGFTTYSLASCASITGLSHEGLATLLRIAFLVMHLELAIGIWQSRHLVRRWIAGDPARKGALAGVRQRLGGVWHYVALFYVLALWVAWAGGVQNAFFVLLRAVLVLLGAIIAGRLAWSGGAVLLDRIFPDQGNAETRHPVLIRARIYHPLLRILLGIGIGLIVLLCILQGWGLDVIGWLFGQSVSRMLFGALLSVLVTVGLALVLWEASGIALNMRVERLTERGRKRQASRLRTLAPILRAATGTVIFLVGFVICLSDIGVNTTGLLAVSSIAGIAVGFGSQKLVQDIITGLFILLEDAIQVGDAVTVAGMSGTVERLSIRTIRLRGGDGSIYIIPFSAVTTVTNSTRDFSYAEISLTVGYNEDVDRVIAVLLDIGKTMRAETLWSGMMRDNLEIFGLDQFGAQGLVISGQIRTGPGQNWAVKREFYGRVQKRFAEEGIVMPYARQQQVFKLEMPEERNASRPIAETKPGSAKE